jgi:hypothetical protein
MRIGTTFSGTVDELGGQSIQTKFFMLGVPLFPLESYWVLSDRADGVNGMIIPTNTKSVCLGLIRNWLVFPMVGAFLMWMVEEWTLIPFIAVMAAWLVITFAVGRVPSAQRPRRLALGAATGVYAEPSMLGQHAEFIFSGLQERWLDLVMETGEADWEVLAEREPSVLPMVFALGEYAKVVHENEEEWVPAAAKAWTRLDS